VGAVQNEDPIVRSIRYAGGVREPNRYTWHHNDFVNPELIRRALEGHW